MKRHQCYHTFDMSLLVIGPTQAVSMHKECMRYRLHELVVLCRVYLRTIKLKLFQCPVLLYVLQNYVPFSSCHYILTSPITDTSHWPVCNNSFNSRVTIWTSTRINPRCSGLPTEGNNAKQCFQRRQQLPTYTINLYIKRQLPTYTYTINLYIKRHCMRTSICNWLSAPCILHKEAITHRRQ